MAESEINEIKQFYTTELATHGDSNPSLREIDEELLKSLDGDGQFAFRFLQGHAKHALRQLETIRLGKVPPGVEHTNEENLANDAQEYQKWADVIAKEFKL